MRSNTATYLNNSRRDLRVNGVNLTPSQRQKLARQQANRAKEKQLEEEKLDRLLAGK